MLQSVLNFFSRLFYESAQVDATRTPPSPAAPRAVSTEAEHEPKLDVALNLPETGDNSVLTRRDVLDGEMNVVGYELSLRAELRDKVRTDNRQVRDFLDGMLIDQLGQLDPALFGPRRRYLQMWESSLLHIEPKRLPPLCSIVLVPTNTARAPAPLLLQRMQALRAAGVEVWLDDCAGSLWFARCIDAASGVIVRMALRFPTEIADTFKALRQDFPGTPRMAWDIGTQEEFDFARKQGCSRFQGGFVMRRNDWGGRELSPQVLAVAALINELRQGADMREIAQVLKQDMAMSYRLLRYVNTAARGLNHSLSSIEQALMVMGEEQLDRWLTLLMLGGSLGGNAALMEAALLRARFLELLGQGRLDEAQCERLFVLGLFSMLDVALRVPLEEALRPLKMPEAMSMALLRQKGPFGAYLALVDAVERGQADRVLKYAVAVGLTARKVNARHLQAIAWVNTPEAVPTPD